jgi:hypothetical protein
LFMLTYIYSLVVYMMYIICTIVVPVSHTDNQFSSIGIT